MRIGSGVYKRKDGRYEARYRKGISSEGKTVLASVYGRTREEAEAKRAAITKKPTLPERLAGINHKQLNLLILGAGSHGHEVMEIARALGVFQKISFLDDGITGEGIIGRCHEAVDFLNEYPCAFIAIGDNRVRKKYAEFLWEKNFILPRIISPKAMISENAVIGEGCVVLAGAVVEDAEIGNFCIIDPGVKVSSGKKIEEYTHLTAV
ncbi:MAG: hypothetical protein K6A45_07645 [Lachnospiraceae bacterium]|nr:hypothetical protein [Lachnospiraceae bacterium]MCR4992901.1 hypothetical protein [Lachnospiraceae bacterium]